MTTLPLPQEPPQPAHGLLVVLSQALLTSLPAVATQPPSVPSSAGQLCLPRHSPGLPWPCCSPVLTCQRRLCLPGREQPHALWIVPPSAADWRRLLRSSSPGLAGISRPWHKSIRQSCSAQGSLRRERENKSCCIHVEPAVRLGSTAPRRARKAGVAQQPFPAHIQDAAARKALPQESSGCVAGKSLPC